MDTALAEESKKLDAEVNHNYRAGITHSMAVIKEIYPEVETDENGEPVTTEPQTGVFFDEDDFSGGIFGDPNGNRNSPEVEGQADPDNER